MMLGNIETGIQRSVNSNRMLSIAIQRNAEETDLEKAFRPQDITQGA
jgi:hypothetical protein